jgi:hypothetical protein
VPNYELPRAVGGERPIVDWWVCVAQRLERRYSFASVQVLAIALVERGQRTVGRHTSTWRLRERAVVDIDGVVLVRGVVVDGLPEGEEAIDLCMVKPAGAFISAYIN